MLGPQAGELPGSAGPVVSRDRGAVPQVDSWFKHRMVFLFVLMIAYSVKLSFFTHSAASNFSGSGADAGDLVDYARFRVVILLLFSGTYLYSYLKNWYFEKLSLFFVGVIVSALIFDYATAYFVLLDLPLTPFAFALLALRLMVVYCVVMNAVNARRAPPMPRRLWS